MAKPGCRRPPLAHGGPRKGPQRRGCWWAGLAVSGPLDWDPTVASGAWAGVRSEKEGAGRGRLGRSGASPSDAPWEPGQSAGLALQSLGPEAVEGAGRALCFPRLPGVHPEYDTSLSLFSKPFLLGGKIFHFIIKGNEEIRAQVGDSGRSGNGYYSFLCSQSVPSVLLFKMHYCLRNRI